MPGVPVQLHTADDTRSIDGPARARPTAAVPRPLAELSPIEHGILLIGSYELIHHVEVPYRVAINEAVELAKSFGGTDGFKFVNGVLDKLAAQTRAAEARTPARR